MKRSFPKHLFSKKIELKKEFFGSSPPAIFVGEWNYPNVFTGFLSPTESFKEARFLDSPEDWYANNVGLKQVLALRQQMVYSRFTANVRKVLKMNEMQQELVQSARPCDMEIKLKTLPTIRLGHSKFSAPIPNPGQIDSAKLAGNVKIPKKIVRVVSDTDLKSVGGINRLYSDKFAVTQIQKILSAGILGLKQKRRMVPTKWSITAVDDTLSKGMLGRIRSYPEIGEFQLFSNTYLGNFYQILLIPRFWSYQLIEIANPGSTFARFWVDWEGFQPRKKYAKDCAGGYYAARLGICEHLDKIRRQASIFVVRESDPSYNAPLGVWVPRETVRDAFKKKPEKFSSLKEALRKMASRVKTQWHSVTGKSQLLKEMRSQTRLKDFLR
jgi:DNA repair protein NreA